MPLLLPREILELMLLSLLELGHQVFQTLGSVLLPYILVPLEPFLLGMSLFLEEVVLLGFYFYFVLL
jgi:hypothetical protein